MTNNNDDWYAGKLVSFSTERDTLALKNISFEIRNGRTFVTGNVPAANTKNDWAIERPAGIAWDAVTDFIVFDSEDQFIELMAKSESDS
ncbi:MAG: hypothetical protein AB8G18_03365 [Gammaproteobacteria bacterium]